MSIELFRVFFLEEFSCPQRTTERCRRSRVVVRLCLGLCNAQACFHWSIAYSKF